MVGPALHMTGTLYVAYNYLDPLATASDVVDTSSDTCVRTLSCMPLPPPLTTPRRIFFVSYIYEGCDVTLRCSP